MGQNKQPAQIAIVDDDQLQVEILCSYLEDINANITTFGSAEQFYGAQRRFDLVITDLNLPNDSGFEICTFLKANKATADTYIIIISSVDDAETVASAYAAGANGYLEKPIIPVEFVCQVENLLKQNLLSLRLKHKSRQARDAAKSSMLESERLHLVIDFVQDASSSKHLPSIAELTFKFMATVGMAGSLMFHIDDQHHYYAHDGKSRELEEKLMMELWKKVNTDQSHQTRFFASRGRVAASFNNCSMFIRGIASGQEDSLLDFLGLFMNQLEKAVERVKTEQRIMQYLSDASQIMTTVDQELDRIYDTLENNSSDQCSVLQSKITQHMKEISTRISKLIPQKQSTNPNGRNTG